jgi:hypothetical protein
MFVSGTLYWQLHFLRTLKPPLVYGHFQYSHSLQQCSDGTGRFYVSNIVRRSVSHLHSVADWECKQLTLYSPVVTIRTTSLTFTNSTFCPHSVFMCFVWIWEQTAIISLYSINWLIFITETESVYCAVRSTFYVLPTQRIYVFCVDLRTNSYYFTIQH